jgi:hypothetical protein
LIVAVVWRPLLQRRPQLPVVCCLAILRWNHSDAATPKQPPAKKTKYIMRPAGIHSNGASGPPRTDEAKTTRSLKLSAEFAAISNKKTPRPHNSSRGTFDGLGRRRKPRQIAHNMMNNIRPEMAKTIAGEVMAGSFPGMDACRCLRPGTWLISSDVCTPRTTAVVNEGGPGDRTPRCSIGGPRRRVTARNLWYRWRRAGREGNRSKVQRRFISGGADGDPASPWIAPFLLCAQVARINQ